MRLGWTTDPHLNFVDAAGRERFYGGIRAAGLDALLIGGDIGEAESVALYLDEIDRALDLPVYFVLGNHDFYRGSIAAVRHKISSLAAKSKRLRWLSESGVIPLDPATALIGHDSWADGRLGDFFLSGVLLNDYLLIRELRGLAKSECYARLNALGDEAAAYLRERALEAVAGYERVIVLTHVPPFRDACWHEGRISDGHWLPHFACRAVGEALVSVIQSRPDRQMVVLCGHTHSSGIAQVLENLVVHTGGSVYGEPALQKVLEI